MIRKILKKKIYFLWLLLIVLFVLLTAANRQFASANPGGTEFLAHWTGTRNFLYEGISPYSDETALDIQTAVYGRPARNGEDQFRSSYPLYSIFFFTPFALISDYSIARAIWMTVLEYSVVAIVLISMKLINWRVKPWLLVTFLLFGLFFYHGIRPIINGDAVILVALMLLLAILAIKNRQDEIAALLLAFSTIKPQCVLLVILFILFWAGFHGRKTLIAWFFGCMILLVGFSYILLPDWLLQNLREVLVYSSYNLSDSPGAIMVNKWGDIGSRMSIVLSVVLAIVLVIEWWLARNSGFKYFLWTALTTLAVSQWIGIPTDPVNFVLLYPAFFFGLELLWERWNDKAFSIILSILAVLFVGIWIFFISTISADYQPVPSSLLFFPFPFVVLTLLYWSRWWVLQSTRLKFEQKTFNL